MGAPSASKAKVYLGKARNESSGEMTRRWYRKAGDKFWDASEESHDISDKEFYKSKARECWRKSKKREIVGIKDDQWEEETEPDPEEFKTEDVSLTFEDVAGLEDVKEEIRQSLLKPLEKPELASLYDVPQSRGILLYGPPGCGKTFISKAATGQCKKKFESRDKKNFNFFSLSIPKVLNKYVGESEKKLSSVFEKARKSDLSVVMLDEIDALGGKRSGDMEGYEKRIVNTLLTELQETASSDTSVLIIAATNSPWDLDPALRRSQRFDKMIYVPPPDGEARTELFRLKIKGLDKHIISKDLRFEKLSEMTAGFSAADITSICDEVKRNALAKSYESGKITKITLKDFETTINMFDSTLPPWFRFAKTMLKGSGEGDLWKQISYSMEQFVDQTKKKKENDKKSIDLPESEKCSGLDMEGEIKDYNINKSTQTNEKIDDKTELQESIQSLPRNTRSAFLEMIEKIEDVSLFMTLLEEYMVNEEKIVKMLNSCQADHEGTDSKFDDIEKNVKESDLSTSKKVILLDMIDRGEDVIRIREKFENFLSKNEEIKKKIEEFERELDAVDIKPTKRDALLSGLDKYDDKRQLLETTEERRKELHEILKEKDKKEWLEQLVGNLEINLLKDRKELCYLSPGQLEECIEIEIHNGSNRLIESLKANFSDVDIDFGSLEMNESKIKDIDLDDLPKSDIVTIVFDYEGEECSVEKKLNVEFLENEPDLEKIEENILERWPNLGDILPRVERSRTSSITLNNDPKRMACLGRVLDEDNYLEEYYFPIKAGNNYYVCGRTGSGKSYTMGVLLEGLGLKSEPNITLKGKVVPCIVIDVLNVFRDSIFPNENEKEIDLLEKWGLKPSELSKVKVFTIGDVPESLKKDAKKYSSIPFKFKLNDLSVQDWISLVRTNNSLEKQFIQTVVGNLKDKRRETGMDIGFEDIYKEIDLSETTAHQGTVNAFRRHVKNVEEMNICDKDGTRLDELIKRDQISIISLQTTETWVQDVVMSVLFKKLQKALPLLRANKLPPFLVFIDELHKFFKGDYKDTGKLLSEFITVCRAAGSGMIMASQRPSDIPIDVLSQTNMVIAHTIDKKKDAKRLTEILSTELPEIFYSGRQRILKNLPQGFCVVSDSDVGSFLLAVRPRVSMHGGATPDILETL